VAARTPVLMHTVRPGDINNEAVFSFSGEGPRSRRYGRTAAMKLIVQPCDEDGDYYYYYYYYYYYFVLFLVMEHQWDETDSGKPKNSGINLSQCHFVHHKSHMD
jgi:hypothetical protein